MSILDNKHEYSLDILRLVAMYLVVLCHVVSTNKICIDNYTFSQDIVLKLLRSIYICAVNLFAITSGYIGVFSKHKIRRIIYLWFLVTFYSFSLYLISCKLGTTFSIITLYKHLRPVYYNGGYWYFQAYFILFFWMPILNYYIINESKNKVKMIILGLFVIFSLFSTFTPKGVNTFGLKDGYSVMWLAFLYLIGSYFKIYKEDFLKYSKVYLFVISSITILVMIILQYIDKFVPTSLKVIIGKEDFIMRYTSPLVFLLSILIFQFFTKININKKSIIWILKLITPHAFAVYLIHEHDVFRNYVHVNQFSCLMEYNGLFMGVGFITVSFIIFTVCIFLDLIRYYLVRKSRILIIYEYFEKIIQS